MGGIAILSMFNETKLILTWKYHFTFYLDFQMWKEITALKLPFQKN